MADNVIESIQKLLQDVIAPDVRELKVRVETLDKKVDALDKSMHDRFDSMDKKMENRFASFEKQMLSAISELKAATEASTLREVASLRERVAVLEVQQRSRAA